MSKTKLHLTRLLFPVSLYWWPLWSSIYRWLYHRKYKDVILDICLTPKIASDKMEKLTWTRDDARALWDAVGSPRWTQHCLNRLCEDYLQPAGPLDCDDYAVWAANCIHPKYEPRIFTFCWAGTDGQIKAHAMCWVRFKDGRFFHVGNWGIQGPYSNLRQACSVILALKGSRTPIGWALYDKNLKLAKWGRDLPSKKIW